ncbi:hypothetical protein PTTG_05961 [Puccinia triticina 1-1 BBBD Race 1]|uniref:Uncharacterized protein n=2 Tax=Puccinia triticina TaxID=208348 RepID=A0A0C4EYQ9_PUCT1|nr:uncharacterized protein PtA15_9A143 [Puccinia triticina]OAW00124.1 hypothetical protein PTTG_05961 [Puccinia triticina 1-1 BBBD Race 1]WAQ88018.1 hypothetical protein PtA15_9A143 [Puccinia triticina]WAR60215.1 hypothetical protein PtB15_9B152 [Puccinia triticina]
MVLADSSVTIRTRVRSAFGRLRPSKSSLGLATMIKTESIPPVPLPVLHLPEALSSDFTEAKVFDDFWDKKSNTPVLLKRSDKKLSKRPATRPKPPADNRHLPVLDQMLLQQGLVDSPISIHLTSLLAESCQSLSSTTTTRRRSSSESVYSPRLLCLASAGPFTPEVVINHVGKTTPESSATYFDMVEPECCLPVINSTEASDSPQTISSGILPSASSPNLSLRAVKLSASPSHRCLKRRGLIPSNQPISSQLLQSVLSKSTSDLGCHVEIKSPSDFKLQPALSAAISVWTDDSNKDSTLRPQISNSRQPLASLDKNLPLPLPSYGRKVTLAKTQA